MLTGLGLTPALPSRAGVKPSQADENNRRLWDVRRAQ
jgi:hypothetical protein